MRWLVTLAKDIDPLVRDQALKAIKAVVDDPNCAVPVGETVVIEVDGPTDLPDRCRSRPEILSVHPSSEVTLY